MSSSSAIPAEVTAAAVANGAKASSASDKSDRAPTYSPATRLLMGMNRAFTRVYHRLEVFSPCRLPRSGAAIVVCNHTSSVDPALIQAPCRRLITWMMAQEFYDTPGLRWIFKEVGVIPVTRSGRDTAAMRSAMRALEAGRVLGLFPEGRIAPAHELMPFQTGVALMAMRTGVPVFPVYLDGTQRGKSMYGAALRPQRASVIYGDEVRFDRSQNGREALEAATQAIFSAVRSLQIQSDKHRRDRGL